MGQLDTRQVCPRILSHYRCSTPRRGDNVRTRPPEYPVKPDTETQEKAKRANKKAFLALVQDQRSHGSQEASDLDFVGAPSTEHFSPDGATLIAISSNNWVRTVSLNLSQSAKEKVSRSLSKEERAHFQVLEAGQSGDGSR